MSRHFILLLDTSGSMYGEAGEKILGLNQAVANILDGLRAIVPEPRLTTITFGGSPVVQDFTSVGVTPETYEARGRDCLVEAVSLAAEIAAQKDEPVVTVLLTDGAINNPKIFANNPQLGPIYTIGIGVDADYEQLARFTGSAETVFPPYEAEGLPGYALAKE